MAGFNKFEKEVICKFLLDQENTDDEMFDLVMLSFYDRVASEVMENFKEINKDYGTFTAVVIPKINDALLKTIQEANLFDGLEFNYVLLKQSILDWSPENPDFGIFIPKFAPVQTSIAQALDFYVINTFSYSPDISLDYLSKIKREDYKVLFDKIEQLFTEIKKIDEIAKESTVYNIDQECLSYKSHLAFAFITYLTSEKNEGDLDLFSKQIDSAERAFLAFLDNHQINKESYFKVSSYLKDIPSIDFTQIVPEKPKLMLSSMINISASYLPKMPEVKLPFYKQYDQWEELKKINQSILGNVSV
jgi:hypothetical protein